MDSLFQDLKYTIRIFARQPGFTSLVVLILGLGVGVNTAIFSIVNAVILRPLPFPDSQRLVQIKKDLPQFGINPLIFLREFREWNKENRSFSQIEGYQTEMGNLSGGAEAERVGFAWVSGGFFRMLKISPILGRDFVATEDLPGAQPVVLLSEGLWKRRFGADVNVPGNTVTLDNAIFTILGVIPASFQIPTRYNRSVDMWMTFASAGNESKYGMPVLIEVIGRLKPGVPAGDAAAELDRISSSTLKTRMRGKPVPFSLQGEITGDIRPRLFIFLGAVGLVLLIACANVAVTATDPLTYAAIALFLAGIALIASYVPSFRAAKVDPIEALRYE